MRSHSPLCKKVEEVLKCIGGHIEGTSWCAGMVVVGKKFGSVRICVDLKPQNESVLREVHPIPCVDKTLARLSGAVLFSKLDANIGFWQIPLAPESHLLTTPSGDSTITMPDLLKANPFAEIKYLTHKKIVSFVMRQV